MLFDGASNEPDDPCDCASGARPRSKGAESRAQWLRRTVVPHEPEVRRFLRRRYSDVDADDIVQTTYLRLMQMKAVDHIDDPAFYFMRAVKSVVLDRARRNQVREAAGLECEYFCDFDCQADEPTPEEIFDSRRALNRFYDTLQQLPERQRTVILLRRVEELPVEEVANRIGMSVRTVEQDQMFAMRDLGAVVGRRHGRPDRCQREFRRSATG
jgi:RNA polymerase sigma-70 factor (ECF subfamily)